MILDLIKVFVLFLALVFSLSLYSENSNKIISNSSITYSVDYSYYDKYSADVLGVYIIKASTPTPLIVKKDINIMSNILSRYLELKENPNKSPVSIRREQLMARFHKILNRDIFSMYSEKHYKFHQDLRNIQKILNNSSRDFNYENISDLCKNLTVYNSRKQELFRFQNNKDGIGFCDDINDQLISPLNSVKYRFNSLNKIQDIDSMDQVELTAFWNDFKKNKYNTIKSYFNAHKEKLTLLDNNLRFEVELDEIWTYGLPSFYLCMKMFGQIWFLELDTFHSTNHRVLLFEL